jgi:nucleotide-binding universal stress UspA family protein
VPPPPPASPPDTEWQRQVKAIAEALFEKISAQHGAPETPGTVPPPAPAPGHASPAPPPPASTVSGAPDWKKFGEEITPPPTTSPEEKPASEEDMRKAMAELAAKLTAARAVDVNVEVHSGSPEEIATAVADTTRAAVYDDTLKAIRANNVELVRVIRNNPILTKAPSTGSAR